MDDNKKKKKFNLNLPSFDMSDGANRTKWFLRVVSIMLAVILWFFVGWDGSESRIKDIEVPLRYHDIPDGYSISDRVRTVNVRIEGNLELLAFLDRNAVTASLSLQELRAGKYRLPVHLENPDRVRVLSYSPQFVEFELFRMIERTLKPTLSLIGEMPDDISISDVKIEPEEVVVKGSEANVMAVRHAEAQAKPDDLLNFGTVELPVVLLGVDNEPIADLESEPKKVRVSARVAESVDEIRVPVNVQVRGMPGNGLDIDSVTVSPDIVTLRGTRGALANVTELTLNPIDVTGHTEDMVVDIPLDSPAHGITIPSAESVRVRIQFHSSVDTRTFVGVPIKVSGHGAYEKWSLAPEAANVMLERSVTSTEPFDMSKPPFEAYVDVTNVVSERLVLPVLIRNLRDGMKVIRIEPQQVNVSAVTD